MPLISQQAIVSATGTSPANAAAALEKLLASYPDCRIVSLATTNYAGTTLVAVIETV